MTGFAETFSQYVVEVAPGGGSDRPEPDEGAEGVLFVIEGEVAVTVGGATHRLAPGGYAYLPPGLGLDARERRRRARALPLDPQGLRAGRGHRRARAGDRQREATSRPRRCPTPTERWATTRFVDPADLRHDMHVTIVTLQPGGVIPFEETHVMEHGLYVLEGKAVYTPQPRLGRGRGRRLHVAARLLPAGLLRRRPRAVSATCSTRT